MDRFSSVQEVFVLNGDKVAASELDTTVFDFGKHRMSFEEDIKSLVRNNIRVAVDNVKYLYRGVNAEGWTANYYSAELVAGTDDEFWEYGEWVTPEELVAINEKSSFAGLCPHFAEAIRLMKQQYPDRFPA